jgi:hypothetical protein
MRVNYVLIFIGVVLLGCNTNTVSLRIESRNVFVTSDSAKCYADISLKPYQNELKNNLQYHWYLSDKFGSNYGGYNGYLLNGIYKKVDLKGNLLEQGIFSYGLKDGVWKYWYPNGDLKRVEMWGKGILSSKLSEFDKNGVLITPQENTVTTTTQTNTDSTSVKTPWYKRIFKKDKKASK